MKPELCEFYFDTGPNTHPLRGLESIGSLHTGAQAISVRGLARSPFDMLTNCGGKKALNPRQPLQHTLAWRSKEVNLLQVFRMWKLNLFFETRNLAVEAPEKLCGNLCALLQLH